METQPDTVDLPSKNYNKADVQWDSLAYSEKIYVPVYSEIYHQNGQHTFLLTATLSIRNTSLKDTVYLKNINYYDSEGKELKHYLTNIIYLKPLESVEFVVGYNESEGGVGANFLLDWAGSSQKAIPLIQAVMIGTTSQQGISFITEGVKIQ